MTTLNGGYFLNRLPRFSQCSDPSSYEFKQFMPNSDGHIFIFHEDEIPALAACAGLKIKEIRLFTNPLTNGHVKLECILRMVPRVWIERIEHCTTRLLPAFIRRKVHTAMGVLFSRP